MSDDLGDRMKLYEGTEAGRRFMPGLPIVCRIDGRSFSTFTKGLERPYDKRMSGCMINTTKYLVEHTGALIGYTQSDEITLIWNGSTEASQVWFDGRIQKMCSQLAAQATIAFYREVEAYLGDMWARKMPTFDARVWNVPTQTEAVNVLVWRELDATKNSIAMAAHHHFSHKDLQHKSGKQMQEMLFEKKGINWNDYPVFFKRGTYIRRELESRAFTTTELQSLPEKHVARTNPELTFVRSVWVPLDMPPILRVSNREGVVFAGNAPITWKEEQ